MAYMVAYKLGERASADSSSVEAIGRVFVIDEDDTGTTTFGSAAQELSGEGKFPRSLRIAILVLGATLPWLGLYWLFK